MNREKEGQRKVIFIYLLLSSKEKASLVNSMLKLWNKIRDDNCYPTRGYPTLMGRVLPTSCT